MKRLTLAPLAALLTIPSLCLSGKEDTLPNEVRWVRESGEYANLCRQTFRLAQGAVREQIRNSSKQKIALVMDLDETVLDNSLYQVERHRLGLGFTQDSWSTWVKREEAGLVPGVKSFLSFLRKHPVRVIFLSNRMNENLEPTKSNLRKLGVLGKDDLFLLRMDKQDTKIIRRAEITNGTGRMKKTGPFFVVAYFGDSMGDFPIPSGEAFGKTHFMLPNPMYGKW
jgi:5'-nucleotidase (lipoprotein e(P4) family)